MNKETPPGPVDEKFVQELMKTDGLSHADALLVAGASMDGAYERVPGKLAAFHTACHVLTYNEDTGESDPEDLSQYLDGYQDD